MQQQFPKIVDSVRDQRRYAKIISSTLGLVVGQGFEIYACEEEESVLVVSAVVSGGLVISGIDAVKGSVDFGLDAVEGGEDGVGSVEVFAGGGVV